MNLHLLGPLELRIAGRVVDVGQPRRRAVLAALAADVGRPVSVSTLVDRVWDTAAPDGARSVLYSHISRLRRLLDSAEPTASRRVIDADTLLVRARSVVLTQSDVK